MNLALRPELAEFLSAGDGIERAKLQIVNRCPYPEASGGDVRTVSGADPRHHVALTYSVQVIGNVGVSVTHDYVDVLAAECGFNLTELRRFLKFNGERNAVSVKDRRVE